MDAIFVCRSPKYREFVLNLRTWGLQSVLTSSMQIANLAKNMLARISRSRSGAQGLRRLLDIRAKSSVSASWPDQSKPSQPNLIDLSKMAQIGITEKEVSMT